MDILGLSKEGIITRGPLYRMILYQMAPLQKDSLLEAPLQKDSLPEWLSTGVSWESGTASRKLFPTTFQN